MYSSRPSNAARGSARAPGAPSSEIGPDVRLRRLAHISGAVDRALALRLSRLRDRRGYVRLGYARFADYVRERAGLAARTGFEMARLGRRLLELPLLDRALAAGEVTWSAAALVGRVAGPGTEAFWVESARRRSVRWLESQVRRTLSGDDDAADPVSEGAESDTDTPGPTFTTRVDVPVSTAVLWDAARELCDLVAGAPIGDAETDEYLLADYLSAARGGGDPPSDGPPAASSRDRASPDRATTSAQRPADRADARAGPRSSDAERRSSDAEPGSSDAEPGSSDAEPGSSDAEPGSSDAGRRSRTAAGRGVRGRNGARAGPSDASSTGWPAHAPPPESIADDLSAESRRIFELLDAPLPDDPFEIDRSLTELVRGRPSLETDLARALRTFRDRRGWRALGFDGFTDYVRERLCISESRARFLVRLGRSIARSSPLERATRAGEIGGVAALAIARIAMEVPGHDDVTRAWIARARQRTVLRLRAEIDWVCRQAPLWTDTDFAPPPPGRLPSLLEALTARLRERLDEGGADAPDADRQTSALGGSIATGDDGTGARPAAERTVAIRVRLTPETTPMWHRACADSAAERSRVAASARTGIRAETVRRVALSFLESHLPLWLEHVDSGDVVAVRDRFRCRIPGCSSRCGSAHHIRFRSQGGPDKMWNLLFVCPTHHLDGIHRGFVRVTGRAPDDLEFALGVRGDGTALERFRGERRIA